MSAYKPGPMGRGEYAVFLTVVVVIGIGLFIAKLSFIEDKDAFNAKIEEAEFVDCEIVDVSYPRIRPGRNSITAISIPVKTKECGDLTLTNLEFRKLTRSYEDLIWAATEDLKEGNTLKIAYSPDGEIWKLEDLSGKIYTF